MSHWSERLYLGTWQFGGQFKPMTNSEIEKMLEFSFKRGIRRFDTATVYGDGLVESILGETLTSEAIILTKVPAVIKPGLTTEMSSGDCYPKEQLVKQTAESCRRLKRDKLDILLLHNWSPSWDKRNDLTALYQLNEMKQAKLVEKIGISLPDDYRTPLSRKVLSLIDYVEAPLNPANTWIKTDLQRLKIEGVEVVLRSLFMQGTLLMHDRDFQALGKNDTRWQRFKSLPYAKQQYYRDVLLDTWGLGTSITIGMTTQKQVLDNIVCLEGGKEDD